MLYAASLTFNAQDTALRSFVQTSSCQNVILLVAASAVLPPERRATFLRTLSVPDQP